MGVDNLMMMLMLLLDVFARISCTTFDLTLRGRVELVVPVRTILYYTAFLSRYVVPVPMLINTYIYMTDRWDFVSVICVHIYYVLDEWMNLLLLSVHHIYR